jgi:hypothetical protein
MATRALSGAVAGAAVAPAVRLALFVELAFDAGAVRLWSGVGPVAWDGKTWTGAGTLGAVSAIEETGELRAPGVTFTLSGVASAVVALALGEAYQGRPAVVWLAMLDEAGAIVADPVKVFAGRMDRMELARERTSAVVRLSAENRLVDFERPAAALYYLPDDQKRLYPGDRGLDYVPSLQDKVIYWGRQVLKPKPGDPGGGGVPAGGGGGPGRPGGR